MSVCFWESGNISRPNDDAVIGQCDLIVERDASKAEPNALTNYQSPITNHKLPITNYQSPITNYKLPITNYQLPITNLEYDLIVERDVTERGAP